MFMTNRQGDESMIVGVPREVKADEYRVAMLPFGVEELTRAGHRVLVEAGAGQGSGIPDEDYAIQGAEIVEGPQEVFGEAELIVKVKEPQRGGMAAASEEADALHLLSFRC